MPVIAVMKYKIRWYRGYKIARKTFRSFTGDFNFKNNMQQQPQKSDRAQKEENILKFWQDNKIFEKTLEKDSIKGEFVFYEGPPTANAKPALHHMAARAFKDVVPRYKTMAGFKVARRAGWDTHGLPVELQIEKKLGLTSKKDIEEYGIAKFNKECKDSVFTYIKDWETFTDRIGYWVDKESAYYTFNNSYIESLWNIVGVADSKNLIYKDYKIIPWCARCGTGLSSHELAQEYQDVKDLSIYAEFKIKNNDKFKDTSVVAWTTTPWTLPGNVALAMGADIEYVHILTAEKKIILAKERLESLVSEYEIIGEYKGKDFEGLEYEPLYPYLVNNIPESEKEKLINAYKVYMADFVTTTDGTGIVHIAPMYGADDFDLGTKNNLPKFHTVGVDGRFISNSDFLSGRFVKEEDVAVDIIKDLAHRGLLFKKEKYEHSYPHCWRCKTPLLYYARDSWFIRMSELRDDLVKNNEKINWEPSHIKNGRFGEWLKDIKDWAISRERYWGTPLPIWTAEDGELLVVDSIEKIKNFSTKFKNNYTLIRHGETGYNLKDVWSYRNESNDPLTSNGEKQMKDSSKSLSNIDLIISSPFLRTKQSAEIVAGEIGLDKESIIYDEAFKEWNPGKDFDDVPNSIFFDSIDRVKEYEFKTEDGESFKDIVKRVGEGLQKIEEKYQGKNILIVAHGGILRALEFISNGVSSDRYHFLNQSYKSFKNGELRKIDFVKLPLNENSELDLHKPYIDDIKLFKDGKEFTRVKEVMDVWFDSGSMPFAQMHYPFDNKGYIDSTGFPADFISEGIDQTRGWFYTLHAVGAIMGKGVAYKNVICLGHLLDSQGKKMSKSIGNIVDPWEQMDKYGADTLRLWMYSVNQPGDSKNYDERTVVEINRQIFGLLFNMLSFYELYRDKSIEVEELKPKNVLDTWILSRLSELISYTTESLDNYKLFEPIRALRSFIDDFSTWYLRRSRERIKDGDTEAKFTLYKVIKTISQLIAPAAPFASEEIWQILKTENDEESVHLSSWPIAENINKDVLFNMQTTRDICTLGNALRKKTGIAVKQPLASITLKQDLLSDEYNELIKDELNIKNVLSNNSQEDEAVLDIIITEDLKEEGMAREFIRFVQDRRKTNGLKPDDIIILEVKTSEDGERIINKFSSDITKTVGADSIEFKDLEGELESIGGIDFIINIA